MSTVRCQTRAQHGFSLIEIMIGIVIGLIEILVIYQVFALAEGIKRNTTSVGDAQQNGLLSSFILNVQLANANNGYAYAMKELATCTPTVRRPAGRSGTARSMAPSSSVPAPRTSCS